MNRIKKIAAATGVTAVSVMSLAMATPAQADTKSFQGCTVTNDAPYYAGFDDANHVPYVYYPIEVTCSEGLEAETEMVRWEQDLLEREGPGREDEDYLSTSVHNWDFTGGAGTQSLRVRRTLPLTSNEGLDEEVYDTVRFRVTSDTVTGPWTSIQYSPVSAIRH